MEAWPIADAERGGGTVSGQSGLAADRFDDALSGRLEAQHVAGGHGVLVG